MKIKSYVNNDKVMAGITLKDETAREQNNMALHACIDPEVILENRTKLVSSLGYTLDEFVCANQTHSANFHRVTFEDKGRGARTMQTAIPETDALYTYESNLVLCSFTADCVPVLFYNESSGLIGVIHSGWQGTVKEITLKLFTHLAQMEDCNLAEVHVQIGAALSQDKFEVDRDVYDKFKALGYADGYMFHNEMTKKYHIDNQKIVQRQCELAGIPANKITIDSMCTFKSSTGFSYRQDKKAGRHLSFILKK